MVWKIVGTPHRLLASMHKIPRGTVLPKWALPQRGFLRRFVFEANVFGSTSIGVGIDSAGAHLQFPGARAAYERAELWVASKGMKVPLLYDFRPWKLADLLNQLMLSNCGAVDGVEPRFKRFADEQHLDVGFFETPTRSSELKDRCCEKVFGGLTYLQDRLRTLDSSEFLDDLQKITRAWCKNDLKELNEQLEADRVKFPFLVEYNAMRNLEWVDVFKRFVADDIPTLFVVGALHTVGADSFNERLAKAGFQLRFLA